MLAGVWGFAGVTVDFFADEAGCDFVEVACEFGAQFAVFGPEYLIYKLLWNAQHDSRRPLPRETIWLQAVAAAKRQEQFPRPDVWQGELHLDGRIALFKLSEAGADTLQPGFGGLLFSRRPGAGEQCLQFAELFAKLGLVVQGDLQFQGRSSSSRWTGRSLIRARTSASQACGSTSFSLAVEIRVTMNAARSAPRSEPANSQDLRPSAKPPERPFGGIVGQADPAVLEERGKAAPPLQHVVDRLDHRRGARHVGARRTSGKPASARSFLRQANSMLRLMPRLPATAVTVIPGENVAATAASFSSRAQRRRGAPSIRSMYHRLSADSLRPCLKTSPYPPIITRTTTPARRRSPDAYEQLVIILLFYEFLQTSSASPSSHLNTY